MVDFERIVRRLGRRGTFVDMGSEIAIVKSMWIEVGMLVANVVFLRNIGRSSDALTFDQKWAETMGVDKWDIADPNDVGNLILLLHNKYN